MTPTTSLAPAQSQFAARAFDRASGAPLVSGNALRVLLDAEENYPAWLAAIRSAQRSILLENYILEEDEVGLAFAEALASRAREGVAVRVLCDWMGSRRVSSRGFWRSLAAAGVQARFFNPPSLSSPLGWVTRDHRKMLAVDGRVGFVAGLCISQRWLGDRRRNVAPWRDTGIELRGPAVAFLERAFKQSWDAAGAPLPPEELTDPEQIPRAGDVAVRVLAGEPTTTYLFRLDQMIATAAQRRLWLTDAYFVGVVPYVQALRTAARDGVDVRLLVPSTTDIPLVSRLSRAGYRPLLEAGVRIFEWNGSMIHAKTAVADSRWARVGSTNLNVASFLGNFELDVAIEDESVARVFEAIYRRDLANSTEIVLRKRHGPKPVSAKVAHVPRGSGRPHVGAARFASALGAAAASGTRALGAVESGLGVGLAVALLAVAGVALVWPEAVAYPLAGASVWLAITLLLKARRNAQRRRAELRAPAPQAPPALGAGEPRAEGAPVEGPPAK